MTRPNIRLSVQTIGRATLLLSSHSQRPDGDMGKFQADGDFVDTVRDDDYHETIIKGAYSKRAEIRVFSRCLRLSVSIQS